MKAMILTDVGLAALMGLGCGANGAPLLARATALGILGAASALLLSLPEVHVALSAWGTLVPTPTTPARGAPPAAARATFAVQGLICSSS